MAKVNRKSFYILKIWMVVVMVEYGGMSSYRKIINRPHIQYTFVISKSIKNTWLPLQIASKQINSLPLHNSKMILNP